MIKIIKLPRKYLILRLNVHMPNVVIFGIECYARRISLVLDDRNGRRQPNVSAGSNSADQPKCFARNYQQIPRNSYELVTWLVGVCRESRTWDSLVRSLHRPTKKKSREHEGNGELLELRREIIKLLV